MKYNKKWLSGILTVLALAYVMAVSYGGCGGGGGSDSGSGSSGGGDNGTSGGSSGEVGWSFATVDTASVRGWDSSIAVDRNNKIHISYYDATNKELKYATDASGSWVITTVDNVNEVGEYTAIGVDSNNKVHIAYFDYTDENLKYATNASGDWVAIPIDEGGWVGEYASLAVDSDNKVHISYYDYTSKDLKYATNAGGGWVTTKIDGTEEGWYGVGAFTSIAIDTNDKVHIAYLGITGYNLKYATNAGGGWTIDVVDESDDVGEYAALAVDFNNKAHISYYRYEYDNGDLKYATNISGTWASTTVDSPGNTGFFTSIVTDSYDRAHITYVDLDNHALRYATNQSGTWITDTLTSPVTGEETSITVDSLDNLHVSYCGSEDLRYAKYTTLPGAPEAVTSPSPAHNATQIAVNTQLGWGPARRATSYKVYCGTVDPPPFLANTTALTYNPGALNYTTVYYWRIDASNSVSTVAGTVWSFTTRDPDPDQVNPLAPDHDIINVPDDQQLTWEAANNATSYNVYFGTSPTPTFKTNTGSLTYNPGALAITTTYYWRIDSVNASATTTGITRRFSTQTDYWAKTYGLGDSASFIRQTADEGYIMAGTTDSCGAGGIDIWVVKLLSNTAIAWQKTYGGSDNDVSCGIQQTADGGYIVAGSTYSFGAGQSDCWVLKLNSDGTVAWQKAYGGASYDKATCIRQTADGGYIFTGLSQSFVADTWMLWVMKLDSDGSVTWEKRYDNTLYNSLTCISPTADGGYIVATTSSAGGGQDDFQVIKLNSDGTVTWQKAYGGTNDDMARCIQQTADGGYIVAGSMYRGVPALDDIWILKLNSDGTIAWQKYYGGNNADSAAYILQTGDGGYIVAANGSSVANSSLIMKLNSDGTVAWQKSYDVTAASNMINSIQATADGGYILAGALNYDMIHNIWALKIKADGTATPLGANTALAPANTAVTANDSSSTDTNTSATVTATSATISDSDTSTGQQAP